MAVVKKILIVGSGAREHAIARALQRSPQNPDLVGLGTNVNPGLMQLCRVFEVGKITDAETVVNFARENAVNLAIIGPEAPLESGVADALWQAGIPTVGPRQKLAQIETSKAFARELLTKRNIPACPGYEIFQSMNGVAAYLAELGDDYVVKADGLTGGKGVKVAGEHLLSHDEALAYAEDLLATAGQFVIEEKLVGEEFSLMSFSDGETLRHMPPVQDHKRAYEGDTGPNTGGMGSYSDANGTLPFLTETDIRQAQQFNEHTAAALKEEFRQPYQGILYGGFMVTSQGVKLIEYNARFGDPEAMNVLALLETDFVSICQAIADRNLAQLEVTFSPLATVCKYAVPRGYPVKPVKGQIIDVKTVDQQDQLYFASVEAEGKILKEAGSRTVAAVGMAADLAAAEQQAEAMISAIQGPLFHRRDIGTQELVQKRIDHMRILRGNE
ncbi:MAG: phosphoribosylamine--glycine ligase [Candidatus Marinimicrobia bacterium]|nr:phosphoribosylamine--glycine ligase [Candidatus Neomarinimicrobiota bacterium]MCF7840038.1 phosphoribosylamine--glycine ligase [Candidatus Neomarinimicrobiota bacterium]MCF7903045.1 phosphoribosylamine--glycine ligase [Candidatus Neomarinimicrobiota bacterium]